MRPVTPCSFHLFYKQFSSLVEGGKIYQKKGGEKYPQHPLSSYSQTNQSYIDLHVSKNINQSAPEGQILTLSSAWKEGKATRGFTLPPRRFATRCRRFTARSLFHEEHFKENLWDQGTTFNTTAFFILPKVCGLHFYPDRPWNSVRFIEIFDNVYT